MAMWQVLGFWGSPAQTEQLDKLFGSDWGWEEVESDESLTFSNINNEIRKVNVKLDVDLFPICYSRSIVSFLLSIQHVYWTDVLLE